jgi:hypothetical protein
VEGRVVRRARRGKLLTLVEALVASVAAVTATTTVLALGAVAAWGDGGIDPVNCDTNPTAPDCVVDVVTVASDGDGGSGGVSRCHDFVGEAAPCFIQKWGWNGGDGCYYYKPASEPWAQSFGAPTPPAAWYEGWCGSVATGFSVVTRMRIFGSPPGQALLVAEAVKRLRLPAPAIRLNPAPPAAQVVHLPTWLWLDPSSWATRTATASVPGLSVTATATPVSVRWSTGDGATLTCPGAGTPWTDGTDPRKASPDCGHTYTVTSGQGTFRVTATTTWTVSWAGGGASGTEPALTSTASADLKVAGLPTVITGDGRVAR